MPFIERTCTYEGYTDNVKVLETIVVVIELFGGNELPWKV